LNFDFLRSALIGSYLEDTQNSTDRMNAGQCRSAEGSGGFGGFSARLDDAEYILAQCPNCHGFYGASSMERLPTELALTEQTRRFKAIRRDTD